MMEFGKKLPWYLKQGLDVTGQGLEENGEYVGKIERFFNNFLILTLPSVRKAAYNGSPGIAIHSSIWNQYMVVKPAKPA